MTMRRSLQMILALGVLLSPGVAVAQWTTTVPAKPIIAPIASGFAAPSASSHFITINVPYQFSNLDARVTRILIRCKITPGMIPGDTVPRQPIHDVTVIPVRGAAQGTAAVTWDQNDFDPRIQFYPSIEGKCWYDFDVQGVGILSFSYDERVDTGTSSQAIGSQLSVTMPARGTLFMPQKDFTLTGQ